MSEPLNIVIAEDSPDDAHFLVETLKEAGFAPTWTRVETASGFKAALNEKIEVVFSDFSMPQFSIERGLALLKESGLKIPFIVVSGTIGEEHAVEALKAGATDFVLKDRINRLGFVVRRALREALEVKTRLSAESLLQTAHEEMRHVFEQSPVVLYRLKIDRDKITPFMISPNVERLWGINPQSATYDWWHESLHPEDRDRVMRSVAAGISKGSYTIEYRLRHSNGSYRWIEDTDRIGYDASGKPAEMVGAWRDIDDRKRAETALSESEERLRQIAENIREVFWMMTPKMEQMLYVSPAYETIWGRTCQSLYENPHSWIDAIHPADRQRVQESFTEKFATSEYDETYRVERPDGTIRWIRDRNYLIRNAHGEVYRVAGTAQDVTDRHQLEAQLQQAQKLEAIGTLAGGIAHDFNNILGAVMGYADLARSELEGVPHVQEYLGEVCQAALRAKELIKQIMTFSRQQEQKRSPIQLRHIVGEAMKLLRAGTPTTIQFVTSLEKDTPVVLADATQVHQIVMNLGTNAAHAMRDRPGVLETILSRIIISPEEAKLHANLQPGIYARLSIRDTGHGMDHETVRRIFEPFFTTKPPGEGTGLGLSVVHGIIQAHDGVIEVASEPGKGTTFDLYFPALPEALPSNEKLPDDIPCGHGERILVVDDEEALLRVCQKMFEKLGYVVVTTSDSTVALTKLKESPHDYALVITDLTMPGITGIELATRLLRIKPDLPVILATGYSGSITPAAAKALGIRELLFKPLTLAAAAQAINRALSPLSAK